MFLKTRLLLFLLLVFQRSKRKHLLKMSEVKKVALLDVEKLNHVLGVLEKKQKDEQVIKDATRSAKEAELLESHEAMLNSVSKNATSAPRDIINFLNKRRNYRNTGQVVNNDVVNNNNNENNGERALFRRGTNEYATHLLDGYFKRKNIKEVDDGIKIGSKTYKGVNYDDLIDDLVKNRKKSANNINEAKLQPVLKALKRTNMPARYIKNEKIRAMYTSFDGEGESSGSEIGLAHLPSTSSGVPFGSGGYRYYTPPQRERTQGRSLEVLRKKYSDVHTV